MMNLSWRFPKVRVNVGIEALTLFLYNAKSKLNNESGLTLKAADGTAGLLKIFDTTSNFFLRPKVQNW